MAKIVKGNSNFTESSLDHKSNIETGTDIYSLGGGNLKVTSNFSLKENKDFSDYIGDFLEPVTLDDIDDVDEVVLTVTSDNHPMGLNLDKTNIKTYSYFGSLKDKIDYSILNILSKFPASIYVNIIHNNNISTYINRVYDISNNITNFDIPISSVTNNYNLILNNKSDDKSLKNLLKSYNSYCFYYQEKEYKIINLKINGSYINVTIEGDVLNNTNGNQSFHIKPLKKIFNKFLLELNEFEKYLLNTKSTPKYTATFKDIEYNSNGEPILIDKKYTWTTSDGYNLDFDTSEFEVYTQSLKKLSKKYDEYKTNIIIRELVSDGVLEYDDEDKRMTKIFNMMGVVFDEIKQFIDGLAYATRINYDKNGTIPDKLVKSLAKTLGWGVVSTYNGTNLIEDIINGKTEDEIKGLGSDYTPVETDIELWRRIVINSAYLFKSKGTKSAIEFLFSLIGAPKSIIDIREYVYVSNNKIEYDGDINKPVDKDGYPLPLNTPEIYFQCKGGWVTKKEIAPTNANISNSISGIHKGDYDNGGTYIKSFRQAGFQLTRIEDNIKVHAVSLDDSIYNEVLEVNDRRLVINSKELDTYLTPIKYLETEILKWYNTKYNTDYRNIEELYTNIINPSTHKVIEYKGSYPELVKIIVEYFSENTTIELQTLYKYVNQLQDFWKDMIEQLIPSTAIWHGGVLLKNSVFNQQKHTYKHGINYGSEFQQEQFIFSAPKLSSVAYNGKVELPKELNIKNISTYANHNASLEFPSLNDNFKSNKNLLHIRNQCEYNIKILSGLPMFNVTNVGKISENQDREVYRIIVENGGGEKKFKLLFNDNINLDYNYFHYQVFKYDKVNNVFKSTPVYTKTITPDIISNLQINNGWRELEESLFLRDGDYIIKGGYSVDFTFDINKDETFIDYYKKITEDGIDNLINYVGEVNGVDIFNFDTLIVYETGIYGIYNSNDYYFSVIEKPDIVLVDSFDSSVTREQAEMITKTLYIHANGQKIFVMEDFPLGDIFLNINGVTLSKSLYRDLHDGGEYFIYYENDMIQIKLSEDINLSMDDIITVTYLKDNSNLSINNTGDLYKNNFIDVTNDSSKNIRINEDNVFCYEYDFGYSFINDISLSSLVVVLNGVKLLRDNNLNLDFDYTVSPVDDRKLLLYTYGELVYDSNQSEEENNDIMIIYYPQPLDDGFYIENGAITMTWSVFNTFDDGSFHIEICDNIEFDKNKVTNGRIARYLEATTKYKTSEDSVINYSQFVGNLDPFLDINKTFYYRITNTKINTDLLGDKETVTNISYTKTFKTDSRIQLN